MSWGYHLILDAQRCLPNAIRNRKTIEQFSNTLVSRIDMVAFGIPQIHHFGTDDKAGYTLVQLIETSNITAHFTELDNGLFLDVFSCKQFSKKDVELVVAEFFAPTSYSTLFLERPIRRME